MGRVVFPPYSLAWGQSMVGGMTSFKRTYASIPRLPGLHGQCPWPQGRPLSTHKSARDPQTCTAKSGSSPEGSLSLSPGSCCTQGLLCPPRLFPQSCGSSEIKSHWPPKASSLGWTKQHKADWKVLEETEKQATLPASEKPACRSESSRENRAWNGGLATDWERGRARLCLSPACLTSTQSTSCKTLGWRKHKLESRLPGEVSITSHTHMTPS